MIKRLYIFFILLLNLAGIVLLGTSITSSWWSLFILAGNILFILVLLYSQSVFQKKVEALQGIERNDDAGLSLYQRLSSTLNKQRVMLEGVQSAIQSISEIGQEDYTRHLEEVQNPSIKVSLTEAHKKIHALRKKDEEAKWVTNGVAIISSLKNKGNNLSLYAEQIISNLVGYLNANQGSFFVLKEEPDDPHFDLLAAYAYGKKKYIEKRFNLGEGLVGQLYYEKDILYISDVPKDHIKITSGLGEALPRSICIVPLLNEGKIYGAIEIASFNTLLPYELEFLKKISEIIGFNLYALDNHLHTQDLLEESQKMTQELKAQEEELRQNMEELTATQEEMKRKEKEMEAVLSSVSTVELDLNGCVTHVNSIFSSITGHKGGDIIGKQYKGLIPQNGNDPIQYEIMWRSILDGRSFSGEFRIMNSSHREMWMAGNFTPILDVTGKPYKIMVISLFTTQDKEKLQELQAMVTAFKAIFPIADISPDLEFKGANDLFLKEVGIRRLDLKKTLPSQIMSEISFSRLKALTIQTDEMAEEMELDILSGEGTHKTYQSALIRMNGVAKKSVLIFKNRK